jgi:hypothetical protein
MAKSKAQVQIIGQQHSQIAMAAYSDYDADDAPWQDRTNGCLVEPLSEGGE